MMNRKLGVMAWAILLTIGCEKPDDANRRMAKTSPTTIGTAGMNRHRSTGRLEHSGSVANCAGHSARGQKRKLALGGPRAFNTRKYERF